MGLAAISLFVILSQKSNYRKPSVYFTAGLLVLSFLGVFMGRLMYDHYFLQMSLPFSLLAAQAASTIQVSPKYVGRLLCGVVILLLFANFGNVNTFLNERETYNNHYFYKFHVHLKKY